MQIERLPIDTLTPYSGNARTHSAKQVKQIAQSIERFGFNNPILVDDDGQVIAGHGRLAAARLLNRQTVPCVRLSHLSETDKRAYVLADNRLAEKAGWDNALLAIEFKELADVGFDIDLTGFEAAEVDCIIEDFDEDSEQPESRIPERGEGPPVSRLGDTWHLGKHVLICGDATDPATYRNLLDRERADFIFTDPPYNVRIGGNVSGLGAIKHREFAMASGEMSEEEFTTFLSKTFRLLCYYSKDGSIHQVCMDWRHMREILRAGDRYYAELKNLCVWNKTNAGMGSFYRSKHELVFVWKNGSAAHTNTFELGQHGRYRTNVWDYEGATSMRAGRMEELKLHPTVKCAFQGW